MTFHSICFCDLDLDLMTFIYELHLTTMTMHLLIRNELSRSELSKKEYHKQTDKTNAITMDII